MENLLLVVQVIFIITIVSLTIFDEIHIDNLKIVKVLKENDGKWLKDKILIDSKLHRKGFFRNSRFFSPTTGKFQPYDILKISPSREEFIKVIYYSAPGRPKGYRMERIAFTSLKNEILK